MTHDPFRGIRKYEPAQRQFFMHMGLAGASTIVMYIYNKITEPDYLWTLYISAVWFVVVGVHYVIAFGVLKKKKQKHNYHEEGKEIDKMELKKKQRNYRDSDLVD